MRLVSVCIVLYRLYMPSLYHEWRPGIVLPYVPAASNWISFSALSTSMLPVLQLDHIATTGFCTCCFNAKNCSRTSVSGTSGHFPRLGRKRHGVDAAAGTADGELRPLLGAVLPRLPKRHRAAPSRPSLATVGKRYLAGLMSSKAQECYL